jgi:hypothetical protein
MTLQGILPLVARALGIALALALLAAPSAYALTEPSGDLIAGSEETVLRLHDLPPGYQIGDDRSCGPSSPPEETSNRLVRRYAKWIVEHWPEGCDYQYEQVFKVPGSGPAPPEVEVGTLNTPSEAAAVAGFKLLKGILTRFEKEGDRGTVTISPTGERAHLIRSNNVLVDGKKDQPGSFLFWRHGKLIAVLGAAGMNPRRNDRAAIHFAQIQQRRLEAPTPYTEAEQDDTEVWLDDPGLKFPIYWAGNPFQRAGGPPIGLEFAYTGNSGPPGQKYELDYFSFERKGFHIGGWTRRSWKHFQRSAVGKANRTARCTRTTAIELERGRAMIYGAYDGERLGPCPRRPPERYYAIARIGRMVIGVNLGLCIKCKPGSVGTTYNSLLGMKAIVRTLAPRPKPVY